MHHCLQTLINACPIFITFTILRRNIWDNILGINVIMINNSVVVVLYIESTIALRINFMLNDMRLRNSVCIAVSWNVHRQWATCCWHLDCSIGEILVNSSFENCLMMSHAAHWQKHIKKMVIQPKSNKVIDVPL